MIQNHSCERESIQVLNRKERKNLSKRRHIVLKSFLGFSHTQTLQQITRFCHKRTPSTKRNHTSLSQTVTMPFQTKFLKFHQSEENKNRVK